MINRSKFALNFIPFISSLFCISSGHFITLFMIGNEIPISNCPWLIAPPPPSLFHHPPSPPLPFAPPPPEILLINLCTVYQRSGIKEIFVCMYPAHGNIARLCSRYYPDCLSAGDEIEQQKASTHIYRKGLPNSISYVHSSCSFTLFWEP